MNMRIIDRKLVRTDPSGYEVWSETYQMGEVVAEDLTPGNAPQTEDVSEPIEALEGASGQVNTHQVAYTPEGAYIGNLGRARSLCEKRGIAPELMSPGRKVCSIGFCADEQKWYGWSHRAIYGFGVGAVVAEGDCCASSGWTADYLAEHPDEDLSLPVGFKAENLDDAKRMAVAFSESVS